MCTYTILDLVPKGRDEEPTKFYKMDWVRYHDSYDQPAGAVAHALSFPVEPRRSCSRPNASCGCWRTSA